MFSQKFIIFSPETLSIKIIFEPAKKHEKKGHHILFIGHSGHPEVVGTLGQVTSNSITLIENEDDLDDKEFTLMLNNFLRPE